MHSAFGEHKLKSTAKIRQNGYGNSCRKWNCTYFINKNKTIQSARAIEQSNYQSINQSSNPTKGQTTSTCTINRSINQSIDGSVSIPSSMNNFSWYLPVQSSSSDRQTFHAVVWVDLLSPNMQQIVLRTGKRQRNRPALSAGLLDTVQHHWMSWREGRSF